MQFFREHAWLIGYRNFAPSTNERTMIAALIPSTATDFPLRLMTAEGLAEKRCALAANLNCIPLDYVARQKVGSTDLSSFIGLSGL